VKTRWIRELFNFSRKERAGIIGLLLIIFILIVIGKLIPCFVPSDRTNFSKWEAEVNDYLAKTEKKIPVDRSLHPVLFNPNDVDTSSLINMGIPPKVAANWIKYLEKGGQFRDNEGVKKIFGMTPELFGQLDSFMVIPTVQLSGAAGNISNVIKSKDGFKRDTVIRRTYSKREKEHVMVLELNGADSLHLLDIPGIGPVLASRIIRYRNLLGGYYDVAQLREIYGLREENFVAVSPFFTADQSTLKTFNINFSTIQELGRHPYIGFKTARKISRLRDKMGKFSLPADLSSVVAEDSLKRLIPYLKFTQ
jgi:DNA uptake protein ComE-like DNA-binding protein